MISSDEGCVSGCTYRPFRGSALPIVKPALPDAKHTAEQPDRMMGKVGGHERELCNHVFAAHCAKQAEAFLMTSFFSFNRLLSRRRCANAAASALL
ncbi:MAG: hypothetical protein AAFU49_17180 [Pseudomonadota bacterium]